MMTREQLLAKYADELSGMLLDSWIADRISVGDPAARGRYMTQQLRRARDFLGRVYQDLGATVEPANGKPAVPAAPAKGR